MLRIRIPSGERFIESSNTFITCPGCEIQIEHSLLSLSKWESTHHKAFIGNDGFTDEEILDYVRCMTINFNIRPEWYWFLSPEDIEHISQYLVDPMSGKTYPQSTKKTKKRVKVYSEDLYCKMIELGIPIEFQKWHLNRLFSLIQTMEDRHKEQKPMTKQEIAEEHRRINDMNRAKYHSKG